MKILELGKSLFFIVILILAMLLLGQRYLHWGVDITSVVHFELVSGFAVLMMFYSFRKKKPINPYFLYSFFIFLLGYSFIPLNEYNELLDSYTSTLFVLTAFFFICGIYCGGKFHLNIIPLSISVKYRLLIFRGVCFFSVIIFLLECAKLGYIPLTRVFSTNVYHAMNDNAIPVLHYFTQVANIIPIWAFILWKEGFLTKKGRNAVIIIALFIIINSLSRQMWLLSMICLGASYMYYCAVSKRRLLIFMAISGLLFLAIGTIRLFTTITDDRSNKEYLQAYARTQYETNLLETYIALYSTNNFTTFKRFVQESDKQNYRGYGVYTLRPVYTITLLNKIDGFDIDPQYDSFTALGTYAIEPYLDFGILGVVFLNFLYGFVLAFANKKYETRNYRWIVPWAVLAFCVLLAAFTNFFNTFFVWLVLMLNFMILPPLVNDTK